MQTTEQALTAASGYSPNWNALLTATRLLTNAEHKRMFCCLPGDQNRVTLQCSPNSSFRPTMALSENSSDSSLSVNFDIQYHLFIAFGFIVIVANLLILAVFLSTSDFRKQYDMFIALAIGDGFNGIGFLLNGVLRTGSRRSVEPATAMDCMLKPWTIPLLIGCQLPAFCTFALSAERCLAVSKPFWYRTVWTRSRQRIIIALCFFSTALSIAVAFFAAARSGDKIIARTGTCFVSQAAGILYSCVQFALVIAFHISAFLLNIYALLNGTRKSAHRGDVVQIEAEATRIKLILMVSAFSVAMVAIPNALLWSLVLHMFPSDIYTPLQHNAGYVYVLFCANSAINLVIYLWLSKDFRSRMIALVKIGSLHILSVSAVCERLNIFRY